MITSKRFTIAVFVAFVCMLFYSHAAYAAEFGPFQGRIVDIETKEPIEGAVVLIEWRKHHFFAGSTFIDAQETLTDKNGDFTIPGILVLNPWTRFGASAGMIIFKSGFKAIITGEWEDWKGFAPNPKLGYILSLEDHKPVIGLKRVMAEERKKDDIEPSVSYKVPCKKWKLMADEINKENRVRGLGEERCVD